MVAQPSVWTEALRDLSGKDLIELGRLLALRDTLARMLQLRLGSVPEPLAAAIASCEDRAALERACDQAMSAPEERLGAAVAATLAQGG